MKYRVRWRTGDKEKKKSRVLQSILRIYKCRAYIFPWDHRHRAVREGEEQPHKLLPVHEAPIRRNNQSMRVNKPFSYQEIQIIKEDLGDYLEDLEKYIRVLKVLLCL